MVYRGHFQDEEACKGGAVAIAKPLSLTPTRGFCVRHQFVSDLTSMSGSVRVFETLLPSCSPLYLEMGHKRGATCLKRESDQGLGKSSDLQRGLLSPDHRSHGVLSHGRD